MTDDTLNMSTELATVTKDALATWSDEKRRDFVKTFKERAAAARYILVRTSAHIMKKAIDRRFISQKHTRGFDGWNHYGRDFGDLGRDSHSLETIAEERATSILKGLPALNKAVSIINPVLSKKIIERDKLVDQCKKLTEKFMEASETIVVSDLDENMTLGEFKKMVKGREKTRDRLGLEINSLSKDALALEREIDKALYAGIPGLSTAVVKVIRDHIEKEKALDQMVRRVEEKVMFGDSEAAMEMLHKFEQDELTISAEIKAEFDKALQVLKLKTAPKATRALKA